MKPEIDYSLYLITDRERMVHNSIEQCIEQAVLGGCTLVQLRESNVTSRTFYETALQVREVTKRLRVPLIINNRADIAVAVGAEGLHIGQKDLPYEAARRILGPERIIGVSANILEAAQRAEKEGADYLGVGAMFPTGTKTDAKPTSPEELRRICQAVRIPVVAIGGINRRNISRLAGIGIGGVAVVSAIVAEIDTVNAARELKTQFQKLRKGGNLL